MSKSLTCYQVIFIYNDFKRFSYVLNNSNEVPVLLERNERVNSSDIYIKASEFSLLSFLFSFITISILFYSKEEVKNFTSVHKMHSNTFCQPI